MEDSHMKRPGMLVSLQKWSSCREVLLFYHCSSCYCFRVRGIVSVVWSIVLSKGSNYSCEILRELRYDPLDYMRKSRILVLLRVFKTKCRYFLAYKISLMVYTKK